MFKELDLPSNAVQLYASYLSTYLPSDLSQNVNFPGSVQKFLEDLDGLASIDLSVKRCEKIKLTIDPKELKERVLFQDGKKIVIAGARYKSLDPKFPFVELSANFRISTDHLSDLQAKVLAEFRGINPRGFTFEQMPGPVVGTEEWDHVVFGLTPSHAPSLPQGLSVSWPTKFADYEIYRQEYSKRLNDRVELRGRVRIEEEETLQKAAQLGMLMVLKDQGGFVGLVGGWERELYGLPALYIFEMFLVERVVGRGLAPIAQSHFASHLSSRFPHLWGHIYAGNVPSLKNAQRVGRKIIQTEFFFSIF